MDFSDQKTRYFVSEQGLDDRIEGDVLRKIEPTTYVTLGLGGRTYFQFAGESQRDECLGNLDYCFQGYTLSFWLVILDDDLQMRDSTLVDNGGSSSHGIWIYWKNNALHTRLRHPDNGRTWENIAYELYPARVYLQTVAGEAQFINYWYHYAFSWSQSAGLQVYLNGVSVGTTTVYSSSDFAVGVRSSFTFGSRDNSGNTIGVADISFSSQRMSQEQIIGRSGLKHYYFTMNRLNGNRLVVWPSDLVATFNPWGLQAQLVPGVVDMALRLGMDAVTRTEYYIDAGDCSNTCFGQTNDCSFYISFWVRFDEIRNGITVLDTGNTGLTIMISQQNLVALVYSDSTDYPNTVTFRGLQANRWYFVEVDGSPQFVNLWINSQIVNSVDYNPIRMPHQGRDHKLLIGKKNEDLFNSYKSAGMFTIDQLDMLQGGREFLRSIGHIQRGIPPHIFYPMDKMRSNGYIDYFYRNVQHSPNATAPFNSFVLGKDMLALSLNTDAFEIVQGRRNEECFNNIEKCVHGILIRGWFKVDNLGQGAEFLTSGFNGIDMAFRNGQLEVSANTLANKWTVNVPNFEFGEWMFLEVSFHPKYGLAVYRDETKMIDTVTSNRYDPVRTAPQSPDTFRVGPAFSGGEQAVVLVDNLEIWYGDRDYVCSIPEVTCTSGNRYTTYIIDFDAWQGAANGQLQHELLRIPARGQLVTGLYDQALDVRGGSGDKAEVTSILPNTPVNDECLGNLTLCPDGVSISFFVKPKTGFLDRSSNGPIYLLSTGVDGIDVYVKDRKLYAEARNGDQRWNVETMPNFLLEEFWNKIIVMWSPIKGLVLARDEDLYIVDEDRSGSYTADEVDPPIDSRFLIGRSGVKQDSYDEGLIAAFDEMIIKYVYEIPTRITHDSFSFERVNSRNRYLVEHPKFPVYLRNGVQVEEGFVGNTSSLGGANQYVDLGPHWDSCIDNLELCRSTGVTLSFRLNLKQDSDTTGQMLLSGNAYDVRVVYFNQQPRLQVKLRNSEKEWSMTSASIPSDEWINVDVTWTEDGGAQLYVNNLLNGADEGTRIQQEDLPKTNMYVGRAPDSGLRYFNGEIDEINFYRSTRDDLVKKAILDFNCDFYGIVIDMDDIGPNGNIQSSLSTPVMSYNGVETVPGLIGRAIKLEGAQYLDVGNRLSCQSRPNACLNGYTMRVSFKLLQFGQRVYLVSSNPAEIMLTGDDLYVRYSYLMGVWEATLNNVELNQWYSIDLTWDDENGMTVYVNDVQRAWVQKPTRPIDASYDQKNNFYINRPSSDLVTNYNGGMFIIDDLEIWDAKRELLRSCDLLPPVLVKSAVYPETGTGYIRLFYIPEEFKGTGSGSEEMFLKFLASDDDGLLWYNKDGFVGSYVYLQNGDLYFGSDSDEMIPRRITFNRFFGDGQDHTLTIRSDPNNMVTFYVDDESVGQFDPGYKVKFLTEDFNVGGHINVSLATNKEVGQSFVGTIKDVRINGTGYNSDLDLFFEMWKEQFPEFVRASCDMVFDPAIDFECDTGGSSVTFLKNDTFIDGGVWVKKGSKPSIKITFTAAEPRGLLLFTGTEKRRGYGEFFAVEIFDRLLYLVADVGNGVERRKVGSLSGLS
ncbi:uncharacterized protein [Watersipora subatra]|uniref:uncharacterized protein n=1 Tax=Watersipora subatra TaxID=2589382 RepID=UPI00355B8792